MLRLMKTFVAFTLYIFLYGIVAKAFPSQKANLAYSDCGSQYILDYVEIENCTSSPCQIAYDRNYRIIIHVRSTHESTSLSQTVFVRLFGVINEPVDVTPAHPCSAIQCPLASQSAQDFQVVINVPGRSIPIPTSSVLTWEINDNNGQTVICMRTSIYLNVG